MNRSPAPVLAVALILAACGGGDPAHKGGKGPVRFPVQVAPVQTGTVALTVRVPGQVEAFETVRITARVRGVCEAADFEVGDAVTPERVLVRIEEQRYRLAADSARAATAAAAADRAEAQAALARRERVASDNPGSIRDEDLSAARAKAAAAAASEQAAQSALALAELDLRDAQVRPPLGGVIQTREIETGRYVQPGDVLATLVRRDPLQVRFAVDEVDAARLKIGLPFTFTVAGRTAPVAGAITFIAASADRASRQVAVVGKVTDADAAATLVAGAYASVTVEIASVQAPLIPTGAARPGEGGFTAMVAVRDGDRTVARQRPLRLGLRTADGRIEVREGLAAGDLLIVRGGSGLDDGAEVEVRREDGSPAEATP